MNKLILILAAVGLLAAGNFVFNYRSAMVNEELEAQVAFQMFTYRYGKTYNSDETTYRLSVFTQNYHKINKMNSSQNEVTYAINHLADLTPAEFKATYLGYQQPKSLRSTHETQGLGINPVDWVAKGDVQKVKDQGQCGSCWAFSAVGSMESEGAIHGSGLANLSEQQLVDCSKKYGNYGCNGGLMDYAFQYAIDHGMTDEASYPYKARDQKCAIDSGNFKPKKFTDVKAKDCDGLGAALQNQPISIAVDAEQWQFYSSGVFSNCGTSLDHGVLLVGYDSSNVWHVKNSWGTSWGEKGFIRLKGGNTCGLCNAASWPSL